MGEKEIKPIPQLSPRPYASWKYPIKNIPQKHYPEMLVFKEVDQDKKFSSCGKQKLSANLTPNKVLVRPQFTKYDEALDTIWFPPQTMTIIH